MTGHCKDCSYWDKEFRGDRMVCDAIGDWDDFYVESHCDDDSGCYEELYTGPDFGCVKFTPKK